MVGARKTSKTGSLSSHAASTRFVELFFLGPVEAEVVYFILVEARNCVEFSIFPRLWPSLCILFWWGPEIVSNYLSSVVAEFVYFILVEARNCVELFFLGCGRVKIFK